MRRNVSAIALEALHNAAKYAQATEVRLALDTRTLPWRLEIHDNGVGIDAGAPVRPGGGLGLPAMKKRAAHIGARVQIDTGAQGTRIQLWFQPNASDRRIA